MRDTIKALLTQCIDDVQTFLLSIRTRGDDDTHDNAQALTRSTLRFMKALMNQFNEFFISYPLDVTRVHNWYSHAHPRRVRR